MDRRRLPQLQPWAPCRVSSGPIIGQFGTFAVENYGDVLYPVVFEKMFRERGWSKPIHKFSLLGGDRSLDSGYSTRPIQELFRAPRLPPHTLVVGGGDLLRTDWTRMASHYHSLYLRKKVHCVGFNLQRLLLKCLGRELDPARKFRAQYMHYPAVGPFILDPDRLPSVASVSYCSCGVPFAFDEAVRPQVAAALGQAGFIYVRDQQSKRALVQAGVKRDIQVGPDLIVKLSDFFDRAAERGKGRRILEQAGVAVQCPILCVQCNPQPEEATRELLCQLQAYRQRTGCEIVLLPLGWCHGDNEFLAQLAQRSGGTFTHLPLRSIHEALSVLAACDRFVGTSLHGNITAFSFGIPHLFGPIAVRKIGGFLDIAGLPEDLKLNSWSNLGSRLKWLDTLSDDYFPARASAAKKEVDAVFDLLFQAIAAESVRPGLDPAIPRCLLGK